MFEMAFENACNSTIHNHSPSLSLYSYHLPLSLCYLLITLLSLIQIFRILLNKHKKHFQFIFLLFCFVWGSCRCVLFPFVNWSEFLEFVILGVGLLIQFITFSFIVLFYAQLVHRANQNWDQCGKLIIPFFIILNSCLVGMFVVLCVEFDTASRPLTQAFAFFMGSVFILLAVSLSVYGWHLWHLISLKKVKIPFQKKKVYLLLLTITLPLSFLTRAVWDFLVGFGLIFILVSDPCLSVQWQIYLFCIYFAWEIIPAFTVMIVFWRIPRKKKLNQSVQGSSTTEGSKRMAPTDQPSSKRMVHVEDFSTTASTTSGYVGGLLPTSPTSSGPVGYFPPSASTPLVGYPSSSGMTQITGYSTISSLPRHISLDDTEEA